MGGGGGKRKKKVVEKEEEMDGPPVRDETEEQEQKRRKVILPSMIKNKAKRMVVHTTLKREKKIEKSKRAKVRDAAIKNAVEHDAEVPEKKVPRTTENTRESDETVCGPDDEEIYIFDSKEEKVDTKDKKAKDDKKSKTPKQKVIARLQECGPRFTLKLITIQHGTFDTKGGEYEWVHKLEMDTSWSSTDQLPKPSRLEDFLNGDGCEDAKMRPVTFFGDDKESSILVV